MFGFEFSVLLACAALLALGSLVHSLRTALPQIAALRQALDHCPDVLETRFITRAVVVQYNDGKVVQLRPRAVISQPAHPETRAAA